RLQQHLRPEAQRGESRPRAGRDRQRQARRQGGGRCRRACEGRRAAPGQARRPAARRRRNQGESAVRSVWGVQVGGGGRREGGRVGQDPEAEGRDGRKGGVIPI